MAEFVNVTNRSSAELVGTFDGRRYVWAPHETKMLPYNVAELCKRQNPVMGTEDFSDIRSSEYLLGIVEDGDDVDPREQSDGVERYDRDTIPMDAKAQAVTMSATTRGKKSRSGVADANLKNPTGIQANYD